MIARVRPFKEALRKKRRFFFHNADLQGVGIDIVDRSRVERMLREHSKSKCAELLAPAERKIWRDKHYPPALFGKFIAAKEALFKAIGANWLGPRGFRSLEIECLPNNRFIVKKMALFLKKNFEGCGYFFNNGRWLMAHAVLWKLRY